MLDDTIEEGEFENVDEEMNNLEDEILKSYVTQDEYEKSLNEKDNHNPIDIQSSQYSFFSDLLQPKMHKNYGLRPRQNENKANEQNQPNKVIV
jgi:hypothetical protein